MQPDDFTGVAEKISNSLGHEADSIERLVLKLKSYRLFIQILADIGKREVGLGMDEWLAFFSSFDRTSADYIKRYINRVVNYFFSLFDQNGDELISREEYEAMFRVYDLDESYLRAGFEKLDANGDGFISKDELVKGFYDFFLSSDPEAPGNWIFGNWKEKVAHQLS